MSEKRAEIGKNISTGKIAGGTEDAGKPVARTDGKKAARAARRDSSIPQKTSDERPGGGRDKFPLRMYLDEILDELRDLVPDAIGGDEEAVHKSRVATRRMKAAVELLESVLPARPLRPFRRAMRDLRRRLGPLRDADVMLHHARDLLKESGKTEETVSSETSAASADEITIPPGRRAALEWLIERLIAERSGALQTIAGKIHSSRMLAKLGGWWGLRAELAGAREQVDGLLTNSLRQKIDLFSSQAEAMCRRILVDDAREHSVESDTPSAGHASADPHALRITGKLLRYTLEMAAAEGWALSPGVTRSFKQVQEALGQWHDWVVLAERAMYFSVESQLAHHNSVLQQHVLELVHSALRRSDEQLETVALSWRRRSAELLAAIEEAFPKEKPAHEQKVDDNAPIDDALPRQGIGSGQQAGTESSDPLLS